MKLHFYTISPKREPRQSPRFSFYLFPLVGLSTNSPSPHRVRKRGKCACALMSERSERVVRFKSKILRFLIKRHDTQVVPYRRRRRETKSESEPARNRGKCACALMSEPASGCLRSKLVKEQSDWVVKVQALARGANEKARGDCLGLFC